MLLLDCRTCLHVLSIEAHHHPLLRLYFGCMFVWYCSVEDKGVRRGTGRRARNRLTNPYLYT